MTICARRTEGSGVLIGTSTGGTFAGEVFPMAGKESERSRQPENPIPINNAKKMIKGRISSFYRFRRKMSASATRKHKGMTRVLFLQKHSIAQMGFIE